MGLKVKNIRLAFFLTFVILSYTNAQEYKNKSEIFFSINLIDSLSQKLTQLNDRLQNSKDNLAQYYRIKNEIALDKFIILYNSFYLQEDFESAEKLVVSNLIDAKSIKRDDLITIFSDYKQDVEIKSKEQSIKYYELIESKRKFKKQILPYFKSNNKECLMQAKYISENVYNYAEKMNLQDACKFIKPYKLKAEALLYDNNCKYNLKLLTKKDRKFENKFNLYIDYNDDEHYQEAIYLVEDCKYYSYRMQSRLSYDFFIRKENAINTMLLKIEEENSLDSLTTNNKKLVSKIYMPMDSVNTKGIYKFRNKIVVVGNFNPSLTKDGAISSEDIRIRKGMATIEADKLLINYVETNIESLKKSPKIKHTYFIPYLINGKYTWFFSLNRFGDKQYRIAYSFIGDKKLTKKLLNEYLLPIKFDKNE